MSASNGVIRIGRKGTKKFAFGEDGPEFSVDVVVAFQRWISTDDEFREGRENRDLLNSDMEAYHTEAVKFVEDLGGEAYTGKLTVAEALDFIARLREQYDELAVFFQPRSPEKPDSPGSSAAELRFSVEPDPSPTSTS